MQLTMASSSHVASCTSVQVRTLRGNSRSVKTTQEDSDRLCEQNTSIREKYDFPFIEGNYNFQQGELKSQGENMHFTATDTSQGMIYYVLERLVFFVTGVPLLLHDATEESQHLVPEPLLTQLIAATTRMNRQKEASCNQMIVHRRREERQN